jgi:predicted ester cyclase
MSQHAPALTRQQDMKQRMMRYFNDVINKGQVELIGQMFDPGYTFDGQPFSAALQTQWVQKLRAAVPNVHFEVQAILAEDASVAFRWKMTGTDLQGEQQELTGTNIVTMDDRNMALTNMQNGYRKVTARGQTTTYTDKLIYGPFA